jgi:hypothetical protein
VTAPRGKFTTFRTKINKDALQEVAKAFLQELSDKKPHSNSFFVKGNAQQAKAAKPATSEANLQPVAQTPSNMKVSGTAFVPGQAVKAAAFVPKPIISGAPSFNPGSMTPHAVPFQGTKPAPQQPFSMPQQQPVA